MNGSFLFIAQQAYATGWLVAAPIGPVNLEIIRRSLHGGLRNGLFVGIGAVTIDVCYLTIFSVGLGAFLKVPGVSLAMYFLGGGFLAFLGGQALLEGRRYLMRHEAPTDAPEEEKKRFFGNSPLSCFLLGLVMTGTNPMTIAFWSALSLQFADLPLTGRLVASAALFAGCFSWVLTLLCILRFARSWVGPRMFGVVTIAGGACLLYFGIRFLAQAVESLF